MAGLVVAAEPSRVVVVFLSSEDYLTEQTAVRFLDGVRQFTSAMEAYSLRMAVTRELCSEFWRCVDEMLSRLPRVGLNGIAREYYNRVLKNRVQRIIDPDGAQGRPQIAFRNGCDLHDSLMDTRVYQEWNTVLSLLVRGTLPPVVVRGREVSIFPGPWENVQIADRRYANAAVQASLVADVEDVLVVNARCARMALAQALVGNRYHGEVSVHSTGDHSSMWGRKVRELGDIPQKDVRILLQQFVNTGGVVEVQLAGFHGSCKASSEPRIEISRVLPHAEGDTLVGRIVAAGNRQNCQDAYIRVPTGLGRLWQAAFPQGVDMQSMQELARLMDGVLGSQNGRP